MSTTPEFLTIENAADILIVPLSTLCAPYSILKVQFTVSGYIIETGEVRWVCCVQPHPEWNPEVLPTLPIMFEFEGFISPFECFATHYGHELFDGLIEDPLVSFWMVARRRGDHISRIYFDQLLPAVQAVARSIPHEVDLSEVIHQSPEDGSVRLQIKWQPPQGETIDSALPFYSKYGRRFVPTSILDVPFGQAVRVAFSFEYQYKYTGANKGAKPRALHAFLSHVSVL